MKPVKKGCRWPQTPTSISHNLVRWDRFQSGEYVLKLKATSGEEEMSGKETDEDVHENRADVTIDQA